MEVTFCIEGADRSESMVAARVPALPSIGAFISMRKPQSVYTSMPNPFDVYKVVDLNFFIGIDGNTENIFIRVVKA